jgi:hypothetical protein
VHKIIQHNSHLQTCVFAFVYVHFCIDVHPENLAGVVFQTIFHLAGSHHSSLFIAFFCSFCLNVFSCDYFIFSKGTGNLVMPC